MANCSEQVSQQAAEVNALNFKALYDDTQSDVSNNRKSLMRHQDAWESLRLRNANFAASVDHALLAGIVLSGQVGVAQGQQTVSPIRTGVGDTMAASAYPANRAVDVASAVTASANADIAAAISKFADLVLQGVAALQAAVVTAGGTAANSAQKS